jgi:dipeptidyl aminopeptidase/acylaminoacyl peptidase
MSEREFLRWRPDDDSGVSSHELEAELGSVLARGRQRRARRRGVVGGSLALVLVAGTAVAVTRPDDRPSNVRAADDVSTTTTLDPGTTTSTAPAVTPTSSTLPQHPRPPLLVVARSVPDRDGEEESVNSELVLIDPNTGKDLRVLRRTVFFITEVHLSADGKHVYFVEGDCGNAVMRVRVDGPPDQEPDHLVVDSESDHPSLSRDGRFLAYKGEGGCDEPALVLRVRDLRTNQEHVVASEKGDYRIGESTWSHDGTRLAVEVTRQADGAWRESFIAVLDPTTRQDVLAAPRLASPRAGFAFHSPTYLPDGSLFVVESPLGDKVGTEAPLMLVVDGSGRTVRQVALGDPKRAYRATDADATGNHLLYVSSDEKTSTGAGAF